MFSPSFIRLKERIVDTIDEILVGDFDYCADDTGLYADVDFREHHPHRLEPLAAVERRPCNAPAPSPLTCAAQVNRRSAVDPSCL
jgi:hypothetical protein